MMQDGYSRVSLRAFLKDTAGAPIVEFAIIAPFLMLVTVGIIDIGRAVWSWTTLEHVARESARYAAIRGSDHVSPATESAVQSFAAGEATGISGITVTAIWANNSNAPGSKVTVTVAYPFDLLLGGFIQYDSIALSSSSTMVVL